MNRKLRIIIADDEPFLLSYMQETLIELGHDVVAQAANGRELIDACREHQPDLVVTDIRMPEVDGIEAVLAITAQQQLPIILVSAYHDADLLGRARSAGTMAYLVKPIQKADLETAIAIAWQRYEEISDLREEAAQLRQTLADRKVIERAKGIVMRERGLSEEEAYQLLQKTSWDTNRRLAEVAEMIVVAQSALRGGEKPGD